MRQNLTMTIAFLSIVCAPAAKAVKITEYTIPTAASLPEGITAGPDGRMWFCESSTDKVGAITPAGVVTEYPIRSGAGCTGIATAHGVLYYTEQKAGKVGAMATNGGWLDGGPYTGLWGIVDGNDGRVWFAKSASSVYAMADIGNAEASASYSTGTSAANLAYGPDGRIWVTAWPLEKIAACAIDGSGCVVYSTPPGADPYAIAAGPDGNLWFTELNGNKIGRMTPTGVVSGEYTIQTSNAGASYIVAGADGDLWFTEYYGNKIGRITKNGTITEYIVPTGSSAPEGIALGPDGALWFTENAGSKVAKLQVHVTGDVDGDGKVAVSDVFYLINDLFAGGPAPK